MISRLASVLLLAGATITATAGTAAAQAALDDDEEEVTPTESTESTEAEDPANKTMVGVGIRLRNVRVPKGLVELFVEEAGQGGGSSEFGFGAEIARRKGDFEVQFGIEYEKIFMEDGYWIDKGDTLPQDEPDFVQFEDFGWVTAEVTFINHTQLAKQFALRYGGGAGIAIMLGDVVRTDVACTSTDLDTCQPYGGPNDHTPYNIPPVMLVVNAILGVQIRPIEKVFINIEGGLRTIPFFGTTIGYYF